jgi:hypothetical protein
MSGRQNEQRRSKYSLRKFNKNAKTLSRSNSAVYTFPVGEHVIDLPKSSNDIIKPLVKKGSLPSLNVSRVWLEKNRAEYILHIGDLDDPPFD